MILRDENMFLYHKTCTPNTLSAVLRYIYIYIYIYMYTFGNSAIWSCNFPYSHGVIETLVEVWENSKQQWKSNRLVFPLRYLVLPNFHSCLHNSIDIKTKSLLIMVVDEWNLFIHLYVCTFAHLYVCTFEYLYICTFVHLYLFIFVVIKTLKYKRKRRTGISPKHLKTHKTIKNLKMLRTCV